MRCPKCNDTIPDNSQFCTNCGAIIGNSPPPKPMLPPHSFRHVFSWADGQTVKKGLLGTPHRGFAIGIILADKSGATTFSDGVLRIHMGNVWRGSVQVGKDKFELNTFYGFGSTDIVDTSYIYRHSDPIITSGTQKIEVWFKLPDGKELYHVHTRNFSIG